MDPFQLAEESSEVRALVRCKAGRIAARGRADRDDVEQDLLLALLTAARGYRPEHGTPTQYAAGVLGNTAASVIRRLVRHARVKTIEVTEDHPGPSGPDPFLDEDRATVLGQLPQQDRLIVEALLARTRKSALAEELGISRSTLDRRLEAIRKMIANQEF